MILIVLFTIGGLGSAGFGLFVVLTNDLSGAAFVTAMPFFLAAAVFWGFAQVIHALLRTADATEEMLSKMTELARQRG